MKILIVCGALLMGGVLISIAQSTPSLAQSTETGASTPKDTGASAPRTSGPSTNTNPTKHRHWRHRGGAHPHYGSRRVRT
ncbi:hypothetical protein ACTGJ9_002015 [Bradyrhizobium sp. RDM12]